MRQILTDHARKSRAIKRGGMAASVPLDDALAIANDQPAVVLALDDALKALQQTDERKAKLLEMRFFGGLTAEESAEAMQLPVYVVRRELRVAQAWLQRELHRKEAGVGEA
jgi:RNA polymerase sigma factor (TIGR02999 family)